MEQAIKDNIGVPKNIRIVCRTVDITDPSSIDKCSVETCRTIIVSPTDDMKTIKAVLAVSNLLAEKGVPEIGVNAIISKPEYRFPPSLAEANNITTLQTSSVLAKIIAHSCTQTGLSGCFQEILNFEGAEFYLKRMRRNTRNRQRTVPAKMFPLVEFTHILLHPLNSLLYCKRSSQ